MLRLAAVTVGLALVLAAPASARHHKHRHRSSCQTLKGADLAPAKSVKLVARPNARGGSDLIGCVLPRGRRHLVASSAADESARYSIRQVAGRYVAFDASIMSPAGTSSATAVYDLKTGRAYSIVANIPGGPQAPQQDYRSFLTTRGTAIAAVGPLSVDAVEIREYSAAGDVGVLDSGTVEEIPPASLELNGDVATWLHDQTVHSALI
jgi:hypothetical protein